jgi:hypothetical protein
MMDIISHACAVARRIVYRARISQIVVEPARIIRVVAEPARAITVFRATCPVKLEKI